MSEADLTILRGDGSWPWSAHIDGDDIVVVGARATCFGGGSDTMDNGETASGISTRANPGLKACSLPMAYGGTDKRLIKALGGSPIPKLPWKTMVEITIPTGPKLTVPVIDMGPAKWTGNALDLTLAAAKFFNPQATANRFELACDFRILGGARFLKGKGTHS